MKPKTKTLLTIVLKAALVVFAVLIPGPFLLCVGLYPPYDPYAVRGDGWLVIEFPLVFLGVVCCIFSMVAAFVLLCYYKEKISFVAFNYEGYVREIESDNYTTKDIGKKSDSHRIYDLEYSFKHLKKDITSLFIAVFASQFFIMLLIFIGVILIFIQNIGSLPELLNSM